MSERLPLSAFLRTACSAVLLVLLAAPAALAAGPTGEDTPLNLDAAPVREAAQTPGGGGGLGRALLGLMLVVGLIFGLHWILRRVQESRTTRSSGTGLHPVAALPLGQRGTLHVVRAGREVVLVGVADGQIVPIRSYTEEEAQAAGLIVTPGDEPAPAGPVPQPAARPQTIGGLLAQLRSRTVRG